MPRTSYGTWTGTGSQTEGGADGESPSQFQPLLIAKSIEPPCIPPRNPTIKSPISLYPPIRQIFPELLCLTLLSIETC